MSLSSAPRINLLDKDGEFIRMVSQIEAFHLLRNGFCELLMVKPPTIQFKLPSSDWENRFLSLKPPQWFRNDPKYALIKKSVIYGNYSIQDPNGEIMFYCDAQKVLWYLNRDIVDIVSQDPPVVRFTFVPAGSGNRDGDKFYISRKENRCVVCGSEEDLSRHHVMPIMFRRHMPDEVKSRNHHDVLLLCVPCHRKYEQHASKFKLEICSEFGVQCNARNYDTTIGRVANAARALLRYSEKIPEDRKNELMGHVRNYLGHEPSTTDLEAAEQLKPCTFDDSQWGRDIVEKVEDIQKFTESWRRHFVQVMNPRFLPEYWDIHKPVVKR